MSDDLDKLEQLARAATQGPWEERNVGDVRTQRTVAHRDGLSVKDHVVVRGTSWETQIAEREAVADAAFIAAANPAAVRELVQRVRAAEAIVRDLAAYVPYMLDVGDEPAVRLAQLQRRAVEATK